MASLDRVVTHFVYMLFALLHTHTHLRGGFCGHFRNKSVTEPSPYMCVKIKIHLKKLNNNFQYKRSALDISLFEYTHVKLVRNSQLVDAVEQNIVICR